MNAFVSHTGDKWQSNLTVAPYLAIFEGPLLKYRYLNEQFLTAPLKVCASKGGLIYVYLREPERKKKINVICNAILKFSHYLERQMACFDEGTVVVVGEKIGGVPPKKASS